MPSVLQQWVKNLPWKQQSILLSGLRAPDAKTTYVKRACRWMRAQAQHNADPSKGYMEPQVMNDGDVYAAMDELEYLPCHYVHHFADAMAVIAHNHPNPEIAELAWKYHFRVAEEIFHFVPEDKGTFVERHKDKVSPVGQP